MKQKCDRCGRKFFYQRLNSVDDYIALDSNAPKEIGLIKGWKKVGIKKDIGYGKHIILCQSCLLKQKT